MKKVILSAMALAAVVSASADTLDGFGVKAGLNFSGVATDNGGVDDPDSYSTMKTSFYIGATYEMQISEKFTLAPELVYSREGENTKYNGTDDKTNSRFNYLNVPVIVKYNVMENLTVDAGPQIGFLLNAKDVTKYTENNIEYKDITKYSGYKATPDVDGTETTYYNGTYAPVSISLSVGASYKITENIGVQARYNFGLNNIWGKRTSGNDDFSKRINTLQVGATYAF